METPQTKTRFRYRLDRRSRRMTWSAFTLIAVGFAALPFVPGSAYLPAWILIFLLCILTLVVLSFPRYITLDDDTLEIHCLVELTTIHLEEIETVRRLDRKHFGAMIPLLGSYGLGGYFGYWFHLRRWDICKVYATERRNLVLIEDIYEEIYIVSCADPDRLITLCTEGRDRKREAIYRHTLHNHEPKENGKTVCEEKSPASALSADPLQSRLFDPDNYR